MTPARAMLSVALVALPLLLAAAGARPAAAAPVPVLPAEGPVDVDELIWLARRNQALNARVLYEYSFTQHQVIETLDANGGVKRRETRVYDVLPFPTGTERHLVAMDGEPAPPALVRKQEKRNERVQARIEKAIRKADQERQAAAVKRAKAAGLPAPPPPPARLQPTAAVAGTRPAASVRQPLAVGEVTIRPGLAPIPACDSSDFAARVRPPLPRPAALAATPRPARPSDDSRRRRKTTGDYSLFELLTLTDYGYAGTCEQAGRVVHVVTFAPPADFDPLNPVERVLAAMRGTILVDALDLTVVRADGRTVAPIKWGAGLVALRSASVSFENANVDGAAWLPSHEVFDFDARVVFGSERERVTNTYGDYARISTGTSEEFLGLVGADLLDPELQEPGGN